MKKICIIGYDLSVPGGSERVAVSLSNALAGRYEVFLVSIFQKGDGPAFPLDERVRYVTALEKEDRLRYMRRQLKPFLLKLFREEKISAAIINGMYPGWLVASTCAGSGTKLIFVDHEAIMNRWKQKDLRFMRWYASRKCERTVALTESSREAYIKKFRLKREKVRCIYNWIETDRISNKPYRIDSKKIISAGRLGPEKGFDLLISAFAPAAKEYPDWELEIYGDGELKDELGRQIQEYGLEGNIRLMGYASDLEDRYADYAMYVLPSRREGMPVVLLEAKKNRLPIVSFDILTGPAEIVTDGVNGFLIEPFDLKKMSDAIMKLIKDPDLRQSMSDHSQDDIDRFSKDKILRQWIELLEENG